MTDIENLIIDKVDKALETGGYKDILGSSYQDVPASFPWVFFEQADSYESVDKHSSSRDNNYDIVVFEADIYSNKDSGAKAECKAIMQIIDNELALMGFARMTAQSMRPASEGYKARLFARYRAEVDRNKYIYHI